MDNIIRKIIIGPDVVSNAMVYFVGQEVGRNRELKIEDILKDENGGYVIYASKEGEKFPWKTVNSQVPTTIEYKIDF